MFLVKAKTVIQVEVPESTDPGPESVRSYYWIGWRPYTTKEDKIYDKHEVWDAISVHNGDLDIPAWAAHNITQFKKVVIKRDGKYALVNSKDIEFID
jgi:hypothetical protein